MAELYWRIKDSNGTWKFVSIYAYNITVEPYGLPIACPENQGNPDILNHRYLDQDVLCHCRNCSREYELEKEDEDHE